MKIKFTILKVCAMCCLIAQVGTVAGLLAMFYLLPKGAGLVREHQGSVGLFVNNGSPGYYITNYRDSSLSVFFESAGAASTVRFSGLPGLPDHSRISFGPFEFKTAANQFSVNSAFARESGVTVSNLSGNITFENPKNPAQLLAPLQTPFIVSMLVTGLVTVALLDCIRRMFTSVDQGEVFSSKNVGRVRAIGWLFIASFALRIITTGWFKYRMTNVVMGHVSTGGIALDSTVPGDWRSLTLGLVILGLAEVFRQGLLLKEESTLTI